MTREEFLKVAFELGRLEAFKKEGAIPGANWGMMSRLGNWARRGMAGLKSEITGSGEAVGKYKQWFFDQLKRRNPGMTTYDARVAAELPVRGIRIKPHQVGTAQAVFRENISEKAKDVARRSFAGRAPWNARQSLLEPQSKYRGYDMRTYQNVFEPLASKPLLGSASKALPPSFTGVRPGTAPRPLGATPQSRYLNPRAGIFGDSEASLPGDF